jgi:hypothetical protein
LSLIQNYKSLGWIYDSNECYLEYRRQARQELSGISWISDLLLWAFYGYGVKPEWTIPWSILLVVLCTAFYMRNDNKKIGDAIVFSAVVFLSGTGKLLITEPKYEPKYRIKWAKIVFLVERLIGGLLIFMFFYAVTRTVQI